jgi:sugar-specific transcriptional regulator TrmB/FixJ family two-component response regulator
MGEPDEEEALEIKQGSNEPLSVLAGLGLSGYQARAYLALLELGPSQAREVSERSGVPQGRVYDILEKLHQRGLAEVLPEAPRRYKAAPFEQFLERELQGYRSRITLLERERQNLVAALAPKDASSHAERGEYLVVRGRKGVLERFGNIVAAARRDVLVLGTERTAQRLRGDGPLLTDIGGRGVRLRMLTFIGPDNVDAVKECMKLSVDVRHYGGLRESLPAGLSVVLGDGERALLYQHNPDDLSTVKGNDLGLFMEHPEMVRGLQALTESLWALAMPAQQRIDEIAGGKSRAEVAQSILVVEDEPDVRQSLMELLEGSIPGSRIFTAESGKDALSVLKDQRVDLIVTDYKLPGMNGLEMLQQAQKIAPGVPRIVITAFPDLKVALKAINEAGVENFFTKPLEPTRVVQVVQDILRQRRNDEMRDRALARSLDLLRHMDLGAPVPARAPPPAE